ncbi:MAG: hypothetical protein HQL82_05060 [Magnetococcales bacterium]|nr:hypothetical protein [Magnetococcales bacterium]
MSGENYKRELAFVFFSQKDSIIRVALLFFVITLLVAFLWPKTYQAGGSILVKGKKIEKNPEALEEAQLRPQSVTKQDLYSELAILTSDEVMELTLKHLETNGQQALLRTLHDRPERRVKVLKARLDAQVVPTSNVIGVTLTGPDPKATAIILQTVMERYIGHRTSIYNPANVTTFIADQVTHYRQDLDGKDRELVRLIETDGTTSPALQIENNLALQKDLQNRIHLILEDITERRSQIAHLEGLLASSRVQFFSFLDNPGILALGTQLQGLVAEQGTLLRRYREDSPAVLAVSEQVDKTFERLKGEVQVYTDDLKNRLGILEGKLEQLRKRVAELAQENIRLKKGDLAIQRLERDASLTRFSYETFFKRNEESGLQGQRDGNGSGSTIPDSYVSILINANAAETPIFPQPLVLVPFGLVAGVLLGVLVGFFYEYSDNTVKRPEDVERHVGVPLIFSIPEHLTVETDPVKKGTKFGLGGAGGRLALAGMVALILVFTATTTSLALERGEKARNLLKNLRQQVGLLLPAMTVDPEPVAVASTPGVRGVPSTKGQGGGAALTIPREYLLETLYGQDELLLRLDGSLNVQRTLTAQRRPTRKPTGSP